MTTDWLGGGLIVALAAVLWLIYLLPTWFRRNEFLSTERNTVRLQQTLRILAETSEVPDEVHVEANARSVAEQQRVLKKANAQNLLAERAGLQTLIEQGLAAQAATRAEAERQAVLREETFRLRALAEAEARATEQPAYESAPFLDTDGRDYETIVLAPRTSAPTFRQASLKLRRARAATSGILLLALVVTVLGGVQIAVNGAWVVLVVGVLAATLCVTRLARLARDARALQLRRRSGLVTSVAGGSAREVVSADRRTRVLPPETGDLSYEDFDAQADAAHGHTVGADEFATSARAGGRDESYAGNRRIDSDMPVAAHARQAAESAEQALRAAARDSEEALRQSQLREAALDAREAVEHPATAGTAAAPSGVAGTSAGSSAASGGTTPPVSQSQNRFASMGVVDAAEAGAFDVDLILAKRRAG